MVDGKIRLRLLVDQASVDIFGNDGQLYMPMASRLSESNRAWEIYARGGVARINSLQVNELKSAWIKE
jgi:sucrose-6-phosphate hydrolase SacC (GH32 family)